VPAGGRLKHNKNTQLQPEGSKKWEAGGDLETDYPIWVESSDES